VPEGHTIHRLAREHAARFAGKRLRLDSPNGRSGEVAALLDGATLRRVDALGKHLLYVFGPERELHVHLGRFGWFEEGALPLPEPKGTLRLRLWSKSDWLELRGAIAIELYDGEARTRLEARIGPDPLNPDSDPERAFARIAKSPTPIGQLLMDQSVLAGIGNIYRCEVLFRQGVSPFVPGRDVPRATLQALWNDTRALLEAGVRAGRIITTTPADRPKSRGGKVTRANAFYVYKRTGLPCRRCGTPIEATTMGSRNLFWCPTDQPVP
jgi:endonuclease VIII